MPIVSSGDCLAYVRACGLAVPPGLAPLIAFVRASCERMLKDYVGYELEYDAARVAYLPHHMGNTRTDADFTGVGFDMAGGQVVQREVGRNTKRELVLPELPVKSVASVYDNSAAWNTAGGDWPASSLLAANAYYLDTPDGAGRCWSGVLYRNVGSWTNIPRAVKVTYAAGLTAAELEDDYPNFKLAVLTAFAINFGKILARGRVALTGHMATSFSIEDFSVSLGTNPLANPDGAGLQGVDFPTEARQLVRNYVHPARYV